MTCHRLSALFALATNVRMKRESFAGPTDTNPVTGHRGSLTRPPATANPNDTDGCGDCQPKLGAGCRASNGHLMPDTSGDAPTETADNKTQQHLSGHRPLTNT